MLVFNEADLAAQLKLLHQALADFEAAGYIERQGVVTTNLGIAYRETWTVPPCPPFDAQSPSDLSSYWGRGRPRIES